MVLQVVPSAAPLLFSLVHHTDPSPTPSASSFLPAVLRKIASKEEDQLGDTSTLADPGVVQVLLELRGK